MRAHTLSLLKREKVDVTEEDLINWANEKVIGEMKIQRPKCNTHMYVSTLDWVNFASQQRINKLIFGLLNVTFHQVIECGNTHTIKNFKDKAAIKTALPIIDIINCIQPGAVNYTQVVDKLDSTDKVIFANINIDWINPMNITIYQENLANAK